MFKITFLLRMMCLALMALSVGHVHAQVYAHDFGTDPITTHPYTAAPATLNADLSASSWSNTTGAWTSQAGATGTAISLANSSGTPEITLTFTIASGKQLDISSFSFWNQRDAAGAVNWLVNINGVNVGSGVTTETGTSTGTVAVANEVTGLTGTVTVHINLSGASGTGSYSIDDFNLSGTITTSTPCNAPSVTSIYPTSGPTNTIVNIEGSGFLTSPGVTSVQFNGVDAVGYTVVSDNLIKAVVPATATTGPITVNSGTCPGIAPVFTMINSDCPPESSTTNISAQPFSQSVCEDENAAFSVTLSIPGTFTYQWKVLNSAGAWVNVVDGDNYTGATSTTLNIIDAPLEFVANQYYCIATSGTCTLVSNAVQLTVSPIPVVIPMVTNATCLFPTGSVTFTPSVGEGLTYSLDGVLYTSNSTFSALLPDTYNFFIKTGSGCVSIVPVTIGSNSEIPVGVTVEVTQPTCGNLKGSIEITGPAILGLSYSIGTGFGSGNLFTNLDPGQYSITVQTLFGCVSLPIDVELFAVPATPAVATVQETQPTCTVATGNIEVTAPIGTQFIYSLDGTTYQESPLFSGLNAGSYTVYVKDGVSCASATPTQVTINAAPVIPAVATVQETQPNCTVTTGSIEVTAPLGGTYTYSLDNITYQANPIFTGLAANNYTVYVKNGDICPSMTTTPVTINAAPVVPAVATVIETHPYCLTGGTIEITAPLGTAFTYSIDNVTYQANPLFTGLAAGSYTVYVKDGSLCPSMTATPVILNTIPATPLTATVTATQPDCAVTTGSLEVTGPVGGTFTYSIDDITYQSNPVFSGLSGGSYTVYVKNGESCPLVIPAAVTIVAVPATPSIATVQATQPDCTVATGSIQVTAPLGGSYTYSLDDVTYQSNPVFANVSAGNYTVYVKDGASCPSSTSAQVAIIAVPVTPAVAAVQATQPDCTTAGSIQITSPLGGTYTYSIDGATYQSNPVFANLGAGNYTIYVKDGTSCPSLSTTPVILNAVPSTPAVATVQETQATCTDVASIEVLSPLGGNYTYSLDGVNYQSNAMFTNLSQGSYTIYVKDGSSCASSTTTAVNILPAPAGPDVPALAVTQPNCIAGGQIVISNYIANYTYSLNGGAFQSGSTFSNLADGDYTITARSFDGCETTSAMVTLSIGNAQQPQITGTEGCTDDVLGKQFIIEALPLNNTFDVATANYNWTIGGNATGSDMNTFNVTDYLDSAAGQGAQFPLQINVEVTTPGGCSNNYTFTLENTLCLIPRGISPNNDGKNDTFNLIGMNAGKVSIFNRYGKEVFSKNNYRNEWFGQEENGNELPSGTYFYVIESSGSSQTGWVYVNREEN